MIRTAVIIDDDPDDLELIKDAITSQYPIAVQTFVMARDALRFMVEMQRPVDFVFTDFNMPLLKGDEVVSLIRFNELFNNTVVTVLSTCMTEGAAFRLKVLGADFTFQKPSSVDELTAIVTRVLGRRQVAVSRAR